MKIACLGGGPAGLYFAISMKLRDAAHDVTVLERNKPDDTFGWGVVLSDETLQNLADNDPVSASEIRRNFAYWDDIAVHYRDQKVVSRGHGFSGIARKTLLLLLQQRARSLGVDLRFQTEIESTQELAKSYDLVIAADGLNSKARNELADHFKPAVEQRKNKFVWLGTHQKFDDAFTFIFEETKHGWIWAHAYQFDADTATFIVECSDETWQKFGFGAMSQDENCRACERIFAKYLGGHRLMSNASHLRGSAWLNFPRVLCEKWSHDNIVLMGDAAATAHFSVGSGTKLAMESAIALAHYLHTEPTMQAAFAKYEDARRTEVLRLQSAARNSLEWFEDVERYLHLDPVQFNYSLLTRSQRISHENLRLRDKEWLEGAEAWFQRLAGAGDNLVRRPMFAPFKLRDMRLKNRVVVSPMAQYKAVDGCPTDWHLVHYGERAKGGAGLLCIEMTCVSPEGRITPGCTGLYAPEHEVAWTRIVDFVHRETDARICCQLGHSGAKGSTQLGWEDMDAPLKSGNWPVLAPSEVAWSPRNQRPHAMTSRRYGPRARSVRGGSGDGGALQLRHARTALRPRLPAFLFHHTADQLADRRIRRLAGKPHALSAGDFSRRARGVAGGETDFGAHFRQRLGRCRRYRAAGRRRDQPHAARGRRRYLRCVSGPDVHQRASDLWPHVPDAVLRSHPQ